MSSKLYQSIPLTLLQALIHENITYYQKQIENERLRFI